MKKLLIIGVIVLLFISASSHDNPEPKRQSENLGLDRLATSVVELDSLLSVLNHE